MLIPNHPDDERLSALASRDADALDDASLTEHVATCARCGPLVDELGALRAALADLPDVAPSRPLSLLPPVEADNSTVDRLGGWARRFFAPVLTAGAALALVGVVGTAAPALSGAQSGAAVFEAASSGEEPAEDGGGAPAAASSDDSTEALEASAQPAMSGAAP
jgi:predicted anti-sigma-YlaC factor YlaD